MTEALNPDPQSDAGAGDGARVVLRCENIVKWFGGVQSLDGVSLTVHAGEIVALCGDNGAGKSTLVKTLSGIHQPDAGEMWLDGEPLTGLSPPLARELGIETVHQDLALCDNLDAVSNVVLGQEPVLFRVGPLAIRNGREATRIAKLRLDEVGIAIKDFDVSVRRLSGGQRQAIAIARAMMHAKRLMMLDEPTAALGMQQTETTLQVIRSVARQGLGVIVISHSIDDIFAVADRIVVLRLGRVILDAPASETTQDEVVGHITGARRAVGR
ncbi:MAG: ribose transport system ATP-binding protein [Gaiellales bacterium]|jgi:ABC-type sugar transport system ATPase subunit|nr:ribose transport system ATP-binding protein [Gaiellales bacterium]